MAAIKEIISVSCCFWNLFKNWDGSLSVKEAVSYFCARACSCVMVVSLNFCIFIFGRL